MALRFKAGDICLHVGGGAFAANEHVEIVAAGPFKPGELMCTLAGQSRPLPNGIPTDYIIKSLDRGVMSFTTEPYLKPLPPDNQQDYIPGWCRNLFKIDVHQEAKTPTSPIHH